MEEDPNDQYTASIDINSKRCSILKPPKERNPLGDIHVDNPKNTRRVSFASSNFIKPFATSERNSTIWDSTYEEDVRISDTSSLCSNKDNGISNCQVVKLGDNWLTESEVAIDTTLTDAGLFNNTSSDNDNSMEITLSENFNNGGIIIENLSNININLFPIKQIDNGPEFITANKENQRNVNALNLSEFFSIKTPTVEKNSDFSVESIKSKSIIIQNSNPVIVNNPIEMYQKCPSQQQSVLDEKENIYVSNVKQIINESVKENIFLPPAIIDNTEIRSNPLVVSNEQFNSVVKNNSVLNKSKTSLFSQNSNTNYLESSSITIENTEALINAKPVIFNYNLIESKGSKQELNNSSKILVHKKTGNQSVQNSQNIYGTPELNRKSNISKNKFEKNKQILESKISGEVEALLIDKSQSIFCNAKKRQTMHFNTSDVEGNMEITKTLPVAPLKLLGYENKAQSIICNDRKRQTLHFNTSDIGGNMEITEALPVALLTLPENINQEQSIVCNDRKRQTMHFNTSDLEGNMEITEALPVTVLRLPENINKPQSDDQKRQAMLTNTSDIEGNMKITETLPVAPLKLLGYENKAQSIVCNDRKRQTLHLNTSDIGGNMEITEALPVTVLQLPENIYQEQSIVCNDRKRHTMLFNTSDIEDNMEITEALPVAPLKLLRNENQAQSIVCIDQKRKTMHFNSSDIVGNMEITEILPVTLLRLPENENKSHSFTKDAEGNMEITEALPVATLRLPEDKNKTQSFTKDVEGNMEITENLPVTVLQLPENINKPEFVTKVQKRQITHFNRSNAEGNMEITEALPVTVLRLPENINNPQSVTKDQKRQTMHFNRSDTEGNMEITEALPVTLLRLPENINNLQSVTKDQKRQTMHFNRSDTEGNMEITEALPVTVLRLPENINNPQSVTKDQKRQTMHFNRSDTEGNMEITEALPVTVLRLPENINNLQSVTKDQKRQTMHFNRSDTEGNMEITEALPVTLLRLPENTNNAHSVTKDQKRQTMHFNRSDTEGNMEITEALPVTVLRLPENINNLQSVTKDQKRQTMHFNRSDTEGNMEITEALPVTLFRLPENINNAHSVTKDQKRQTMHFNRSDTEGNMEITEALPVTVLRLPENINNPQSVTKDQKRQTMHFNRSDTEGNMEITEALPVTLFRLPENINNPQSVTEDQKRQTMHFNRSDAEGNMEITEALPVTLLRLPENINNPQSVTEDQKRQTMHFNRSDAEGNMEITEALPVTLLRLPENINNPQSVTEDQKRQTMHFNRSDTEGNMVITEALPVTLLQLPENINNLQSVTKDQKRQTMHFNRSDTEGNMEITEALPVAILQLSEDENKSQSITKDAESNMEIIKTLPVAALIFPENINKSQSVAINDDNSIIMHFNKSDAEGNIKITEALPVAILQYPENKFQSVTKDLKRQTMYFNKSDTQNMEIMVEDIKESQFTVLENEKRRTIHLNNSNEEGNLKKFEAQPDASYNRELVEMKSKDFECKVYAFNESEIEKSTSVFEVSLNKTNYKESSQQSEVEINSQFFTPQKNLLSYQSDDNSIVKNTDIKKNKSRYSIEVYKNVDDNLMVSVLPTVEDSEIQVQKDPVISDNILKCSNFDNIKISDKTKNTKCPNSSMDLNSFSCFVSNEELEQDVKTLIYFDKNTGLKVNLPEEISLQIIEFLQRNNNVISNHSSKDSVKLNLKRKSTDNECSEAKMRHQSQPLIDIPIINTERDLNLSLIKNCNNTPTNKEEIYIKNTQMLSEEENILRTNSKYESIDLNIIKNISTDSFIDNAVIDFASNDTLEEQLINVVKSAAKNSASFYLSENLLGSLNKSFESTETKKSEIGNNSCIKVKQNTDNILQPELENDSEKKIICLENKVNENNLSDFKIKSVKIIDNEHYNKSRQEKPLTTQELIEIESKKNECRWKIEYFKKSEWKFSYLLNSLKLTFNVHENVNNSNVRRISNVTLNSICKESWQPACHYVHYVLNKKYTSDYLKNICKFTSNILEILESISEDIKKLHEFVNDIICLGILYGLKFDRQWRAVFLIGSVILKLAITVTVDMSDWDHTIEKNTIEKKITVDCATTNTKEKEILSIAESIKSDSKWLRNFVKDVRDYIDILEFQSESCNS